MMPDNRGLARNTDFSQTGTSLKCGISNLFNICPNGNTFKHFAVFKSGICNQNNITVLIRRTNRNLVAFTDIAYNCCSFVVNYLIDNIKFGVFLCVFFGPLCVFFGPLCIIFRHYGIHIEIVIPAEFSAHRRPQTKEVRTSIRPLLENFGAGTRPAFEAFTGRSAPLFVFKVIICITDNAIIVFIVKIIHSILVDSIIILIHRVFIDSIIIFIQFFLTELTIFVLRMRYNKFKIDYGVFFCSGKQRICFREDQFHPLIHKAFVLLIVLISGTNRSKSFFQLLC